jgi:hypothetical protein
MSETPVELLLRAATFAAEKHKSQLRKSSGATRPTSSIRSRSQTCWREGRFDDVTILIAAIESK